MQRLSGFVFLNGRIVKAERASVSVFDRGFLYGDGLFETLRTYHGVPFALDAHLRRMHGSARMLGLEVPDYNWATVVQRLLKRNRLDRIDAAVRLTVTRGTSGPDLTPPPEPQPTTLVTARKLDPKLPETQRRGIRVTLLPFGRDGFCAEHKLLGYVPAILGKALAAERGCNDGIYLEGDGTIREATTASVFVVRGQSLLTTPTSGILPGITRRTVLDLAAADGIRVVERQLRRADLQRSQEVFLTSSVAEIVPVVRVDERAVGSGRPGSMTKRIQRLYRLAVEQHCS